MWKHRTADKMPCRETRPSIQLPAGSSGEARVIAALARKTRLACAGETAGPSLVPSRRPFFEEGADAFIGVSRHHVLDHDLGCVAVGVGQPHLALLVEGLLAELHHSAGF